MKVVCRNGVLLASVIIGPSPPSEITCLSLPAIISEKVDHGSCERFGPIQHDEVKAAVDTLEADMHGWKHRLRNVASILDAGTP
jgi:hypothetical protein